MTGQALTHLVCPHCGSTNRVPADKPALQARCGGCKQALFTGKPTAATTAAFDKHLNRDEIPLLVDFWAAWCGPCRAMAPHFERAAALFEPRLRLLKVDTEAEPAMAQRYQIRSIPSLLLFDRGRLVAQRAGASDLAGLRAWVEEQLGRAG